MGMFSKVYSYSDNEVSMLPELGVHLSLSASPMQLCCGKPAAFSLMAVPSDVCVTCLACLVAMEEHSAD